MTMVAIPLASSSSPSPKRVKGYDPRGPVTCDEFPRVCWVTGSPGPDCCRRRCVNIDSNTNNCGRCGRHCSWGEICCRGDCVNALLDSENCGGCGNKCNESGFCKQGLCDYA
ncbi:pectate lyase [Dendrobium catenatum]|uniref:Pectate lyase n=1 Tax=Dendrobium catenatum TaxID=906689 RepID=A0A2I0WP44_9ASPA|nr:pectate lyase [Dendrobium catenatum]